jgi:hypothetical protein
MTGTERGSDARFGGYFPLLSSNRPNPKSPGPVAFGFYFLRSPIPSRSFFDAQSVSYLATADSDGVGGRSMRCGAERPGENARAQRLSPRVARICVPVYRPGIGGSILTTTHGSGFADLLSPMCAIAGIHPIACVFFRSRSLLFSGWHRPCSSEQSPGWGVGQRT